MKQHPLKCPNCAEYRYMLYEKVLFTDDEGKKGFHVVIPVYRCESCAQKESVIPSEKLQIVRDDLLKSILENEFISEIPLKNLFSKIDRDRRFEQFDHLGFDYDPRDYYLIPGLFRPFDDGFLTPVFFDKDILLYYNNHPAYTVQLTSFSSGNIYHKGEKMFKWGFGINRGGKLFMWLGDLDREFDGEEMIAHLKRFQASNIPSDSDTVSKFYFSQTPFSVEDAFQTSDNEKKLFKLFNHYNNQIKGEFDLEIAKVDIDQLTEYYKPPILEEREQIFGAYLSLNKYFIENIQGDNLKVILKKHGFTDNDFERNGKKLGTLKVFTMALKEIHNLPDPDKSIAPLFVLNDLRQLHGHLNQNSFESRYNSCKERIGLESEVSDLEVFQKLIKDLIVLYESILDTGESKSIDNT